MLGGNMTVPAIAARVDDGTGSGWRTGSHGNGHRRLPGADVDCGIDVTGERSEIMGEFFSTTSRREGDRRVQARCQANEKVEQRAPFPGEHDVWPEGDA
jgi:hypothetical protein